MVNSSHLDHPIPVYKSAEDLPFLFGVAELSSILGVSKNKAYEIVGRPDFPKYRVNSKIIISKKHFLAWLDSKFD